MNSWDEGFRSPSPAGSSSSGDNGGNSAVRYTDLTLDVQLAKDLDLTSRVDRAIPKDNPFTIAKRRATRKLNPTTEAKKPRGNIKPVVTTAAVVREDNGPRKRATAAAEGLTRGWKPHNGWLDGKNNPISMDEKVPSMLEALDEQEKAPLKGGKKKRAETASKKPAAKKQEKATKRKQLEDDKLVFTRIPTGAKPSKDYPILQGLAKQSSLPKKQKKTTISSRVSTSSESDADFSIADLIKGSTNGKMANSKPVKTVFEAVRTSSTVQHDGDRLPFGIEKLAQRIRPRLPSGSKTAVDSGSVSPTGGFDASSPENISTITHLPSSVCRALDTSKTSTSSAYTSPLRGRNPSLELIRPRPQRVTEAVQLEALAALDDDRAISRYEDERRQRNLPQSTKEDNQKLRDRLCDIERTLQASRQSTPPRLSMRQRRLRSPSPTDTIGKRLRQTFNPRRESAVSPEWATLPRKKNERAASLANSNRKANDKFRMPVNLFGRRAPPRESSPNRVSKPESQPQRTTKVTLFTPTPRDHVDHLPTPSQVYEVQTIKGSKFGATLSEQGQRSGVYEQVQSRDQCKIKRPRFTRDPEPSSTVALAVDEVEDDWTKAWRRPKTDTDAQSVARVHYRGYEAYGEQHVDHQEEDTAAHSGRNDLMTDCTYVDDQQGVDL